MAVSVVVIGSRLDNDVVAKVGMGVSQSYGSATECWDGCAGAVGEVDSVVEISFWAIPEIVGDVG